MMKKRGSFATSLICLVFLLYSSFFARSVMEAFFEFSQQKSKEIDALESLTAYDLRAQLYSTIRKEPGILDDFDQEVEINDIIVFKKDDEIYLKGE